MTAEASGETPRARARDRPSRRNAGILAFLASALLVAGAPCAAGPATNAEAGGEIAHVVELFTSQGCRACPPAERLLGAVEGESVLTLSYHVDYWDYIGWRDTYGSKANTARQEAYGESFDLLSLTTPQLVIDGSRQLVGAGADQLDAVLETMPGLDPDKASIEAWIAGENLKVSAHVNGATSETWPLPVVILVTYDARSDTHVTRGANLGTDIAETHPVRDWQILGALAGEPMKVSLPVAAIAEGAKAEHGCAVLIQMMSRSGEPGPILAATRLDLASSTR